MTSGSNSSVGGGWDPFGWMNIGWTRKTGPSNDWIYSSVSNSSVNRYTGERIDHNSDKERYNEVSDATQLEYNYWMSGDILNIHITGTKSSPVANTTNNGGRQYLDIPYFEDGSSLTFGKDFARDLQSYYENGKGVDYVISKRRLYDIYNAAVKGNGFNWSRAESLGNNMYSVPMNLYNTDYHYSFGRASMTYYVNPSNGLRIPTGFYDEWNLDPKPWGTRSFPAETVTRYYNWRLNGENFIIRYP